MLIGKKLPCSLHGWAFCKISVYFNQESFRPKSKYSNSKGEQPIIYKANFSLKGTMYLIDVKFNITYQNKQRILRLDHFLELKCT